MTTPDIEALLDELKFDTCNSWTTDFFSSLIKRYSDKPIIVMTLLSKLLELEQKHSLEKSILDYYITTVHFSPTLSIGMALDLLEYLLCNKKLALSLFSEYRFFTIRSDRVLGTVEIVDPTIFNKSVSKEYPDLTWSTVLSELEYATSVFSINNKAIVLN